MVWPARCDAWRMTAANNGPETSASTSAFEPTAVITICPQHIRDVPLGDIRTSSFERPIWPNREPPARNSFKHAPTDGTAKISDSNERFQRLTNHCFRLHFLLTD